jgi:hypothetical protein
MLCFQCDEQALGVCIFCGLCKPQPEPIEMPERNKWTVAISWCGRTSTWLPCTR